MRRFLVAASSIIALAACATPERSAQQQNDSRLAKLTVDRLEKFDSEKEFADYLKRVRTLAHQRGHWWAGALPQYASLDQPPCDPTIQECEERDVVVVTGAKRESSSESAMAVTAVSAESSGADASITNVQKIGVDEGDIVKRIGKHLVVLQDGRLFSVDMDTLSLSDRADVYRDRYADGAWYDEILVSGRRVLVTGYSYREDATQLTVMAMDESGRFTREGTFYLSSDDYYDTSNYATRLVGDKLVIYSPIYLTDISPGDAISYPLVRRWDNQKASVGEPRQLFNAKDIYKPVQQTIEPTVHTLSVCDLGAEAMDRNLECRTTAFVGPPSRTFYVSPDEVFLWLAGGDDNAWEATCHTEEQKLAFDDGLRSSVYRIPLSGARPAVMHTRGAPSDQFSMDSSSGEFRALVFWGRTGCDDETGEDGSAQLRYLSAPMSMFRDNVRTAPQARYVETPALPIGTSNYENRFTDTHVVYGARHNWWGRAPRTDEAPKSTNIVAVPVSSPANASIIAAPHDINRLERIGPDIVATGYRDWKGLSVSMLDLNSAPKLASTLQLEGRYESEGRSHAFNAKLDRDGDGLMGIPTVSVAADSYRHWWRSDESDVTFMSFDKANKVEEAGALLAGKDNVHPAYKCEVSCIDWYGNARPIFIGERVYALTGTEIVEGRLAEGKVIEVRRLNMTAPKE